MSDKAYEWIEYKLTDGVATITFIAPQFNNALGLKSAGVSRRAVPRRGGRRGRRGGGHGARQGLLRRFQSQGNRSRTSTWKKSPRTFACCDVVASDPSSVHPHAQADPGSGQRRRGRLGTGDDALCRHGGLQGQRELLSAWHTIGIANDATTSYSLAKIVGFRHAMEWMMTNRTVCTRGRLLSGTS